MTRDEFTEVRERLGFTIAEVAALTGYSKETALHWSSGRKPVPKPAEKILNLVLGRVTAEEMLVSVRTMAAPERRGPRPRGRPFTREDGLKAIARLRPPKEEKKP
jgi:transcriptional regulator with XRE-family HTH domain